MLQLMLLAGLGGFLGTCTRFLTNRFFLNLSLTNLPIATFTINIIGCSLFGLITGILNHNNIMSPRINAFLLVGFCGGFTTFSSFGSESLNLINSGQIFTSIAYIGISVILGLIGVALGLAITR